MASSTRAAFGGRLAYDKPDRMANRCAVNSIQIKRLDAGACERWDEFVQSNERASFFHLTGWKEAVERTFGWPTYYLYAEGDLGIEGVLPLAHVKSRLFGNALISAPYAVYGGIVADSEAARSALDAAAVDLAQSLQVDYLEMRQREAGNGEHPTKELYVTFRREIPQGAEDILKSIPRKQRAVVRKGIKNELVGEVDENVDAFFNMYSRSVRNLGTPVLSKNWFATLADVFGSRCEVLTIRKDGRPVSGVMSFYFRDEVLPYYGGGDDEARLLKANDFMYFDLMCKAAEAGVRVFDYGRSKLGTGSYNFKKNWGFEPQSLPYQYHLVNTSDLPDLNPLNPKYRLMIRTWQRLPLALTRIIGPLVARNLA